MEGSLRLPGGPVRWAPPPRPPRAAAAAAAAACAAAAAEFTPPLLADNGHVINVSSGAGTRAFGKMSDAERHELDSLVDDTSLRTVISRHAQAVAAEAHRPGDTPVYAISKVSARSLARSLARFLTHSLTHSLSVSLSLSGRGQCLYTAECACV